MLHFAAVRKLKYVRYVVAALGYVALPTGFVGYKKRRRGSH